MYVLSETYDPSAPEAGGWQEVELADLYLMMGRGLESLDCITGKCNATRSPKKLLTHAGARGESALQFLRGTAQPYHTRYDTRSASV